MDDYSAEFKSYASIEPTICENMSQSECCTVGAQLDNHHSELLCLQTPPVSDLWQLFLLCFPLLFYYLFWGEGWGVCMREGEGGKGERHRMQIQTDGKYFPPGGSHVRLQSTAALCMTTLPSMCTVCVCECVCV